MEPVIFKSTLDAAVKHYLGGADPADPRVNALFGDFKALPPVRIDVGNDELVLDDALRFHHLAATAGHACDVHVWEGRVHVFPATFAMLDAAATALGDAASFLRDTLVIDPQVRRCV